MNWAGALETAAYPTIFAAAAIEGEVIFVAACTLVAAGRLDASGVFLAAALGGTLGDQFYFYAFRGRLARWLGHLPSIERRKEWIMARVKQRATAMILASRFLPGLRISIPLACAYAGVSPLRFSVLSVASALAWSLTIMAIVLGGGAALIAGIGTDAWWTALPPAALILLFIWWLSRAPATRDQAG